jgi:D-3-phosphoglycerate dehydrogenase
LVCDKLADEGVAVLGRAADVEVLSSPPSEDALCEMVVPYHALVVRSGTKVTAAAVAAGVELRVIGRAGTGVDNIDVDAATERGVLVLNCPGGNSMAAAEHAIAMMMALARSVPQADASMKGGEWRKSDFMGTEVFRKTLGIIGVGRIGELVAQRARGLEMQVLGCDPLLTPERAEELRVEKVELDELLQRADFVTVHAARTPETAGLIGKRELALMKPSARLINCARGGIVDEDGLWRALQSGALAGAALDVFETEPPGKTPLFELPNVIATPHIGAATREAQVNVAVDVAEQIVAVLAGGEPRAPVNVPKGRA